MSSPFATAEHEAFRQSVRRLAEEKVAPWAAVVDREARWPQESVDACIEAGLAAVPFAEEFGGQGGDHVTNAILVEELARACASTALAFAVNSLAMLPLLSPWSNDDLRRRFIPLVAGGRTFGSYALSEADAGSDVANLRLRAVRDGDDYVLTGTKQWISNAGQSGIYVVFAKTDPQGGNRGISAFVVEAERGIQVTKLEDKLGIRASPTGALAFDGVRVPAANRIGEEGDGFKVAMWTLDRSRPAVGAQAVGIAQAALDTAVDWMKQRVAFGKPIAELQGLQFMVAEMAMKIEASRTMVYRACAMADAGDPDGELGVAGAMAKWLASDTAMQVSTDAVQLLGGYGYVKDFPAERFMRDAKITQIYEGTNQIQRVVIARSLLR